MKKKFFKVAGSVCAVGVMAAMILGMGGCSFPTKEQRERRQEIGAVLSINSRFEVNIPDMNFTMDYMDRMYCDSEGIATEEGDYKAVRVYILTVGPDYWHDGVGYVPYWQEIVDFSSGREEAFECGMNGGLAFLSAQKKHEEVKKYLPDWEEEYKWFHKEMEYKTYSYVGEIPYRMNYFYMAYFMESRRLYACEFLK